MIANNAVVGDVQITILTPERFPGSDIGCLRITQNSVDAYLAVGEMGLKRAAVCEVKVVGFKRPNGRYIRIVKILEELPPHLVSGKYCSECAAPSYYGATKCKKCGIIFTENVVSILAKYI